MCHIDANVHYAFTFLLQTSIMAKPASIRCAKRSILAMLIITVIFFKWKQIRILFTRKRQRNTKHWHYCRLKKMIKENDIQLPAMFVDLDLFQDNIRKKLARASMFDKSVRLSTRSIRCPYLMQEILRISNRIISGNQLLSAIF